MSIAKEYYFFMLSYSSAVTGCMTLCKNDKPHHGKTCLRRGKTQTLTKTGPGLYSYRSISVYHDGVPHVFVSHSMKSTSIWSVYFPFYLIHLAHHNLTNL